MQKNAKKIALIAIGLVLTGSIAATSAAMAATSATSAANGNGRAAINNAAQKIPGPGRGMHQGWNMENKGMVIGKITAISGNTLTLTTTPPPARPNQAAPTAGANAPVLPAFTARTFTVNASSASILVDGETAAFGKLAVGDQIVVKGTASSTDSAQITAQIIDKITDAFKNRVHYRILGQITAVNGNTLTVKDSSGTSYTVNAERANIIINGTKSEIGKLAVGDQIMVGGFAKDSTTAAITAGNIFKGTAINQAPGPKMGQGKGMGRGMGRMQ